MKTKNSFLYLSLFLIIFIFAACSSDDDDSGYSGKNQLYLTSETSVLEDTEEGVLNITVMLTKSLNKDVELKFKLSDNAYNNINIASLTNSTVQIKAGEKTAKLELRSNNKGILTNETAIKVELETASDTSIEFTQPLLVTVKPGAQTTPLTEAQLKLIENYKSNGYDITKWIGMVPVKVRVIFPGGGYYAPFLDKYERTIEGKTFITLSENATTDKIVLKMASNAMGIESYLYDLLRGLTILNTDFWTNQPQPQATIKLIGLSADKAETFGLALDNLELNKDNSTISFIDYNMENVYGYELAAVNFNYSYSAWDRLKKLIDAGNQDAIDANEQGGSVNPSRLLNVSSIVEDAYDGSATLVQPSSSFNVQTGEMKFIFNLDHIDAGDYIRFEVTYSAIK